MTRSLTKGTNPRRMEKSGEGGIKMARKLFCQLGPWAYWLSRRKEVLRRKLYDRARGPFAVQRQPEPLPALVYRHRSLIRRRLGQVDMALQENKAVNLALAAPKVCGVLIRPGETFSFWRLVGPCTKRRGYQVGMTISNGAPGRGIGGGMCQFTNLIHWMVLHSPLTITERHHHENLDLFPDFGRQVPFGVGTSIAYNYLDYRFRNDTGQCWQLLTWVEGAYLCGELRAQCLPAQTFHIHVADERFVREGHGIYRCNTILRQTVDRRTGNSQVEVLQRNRARVLYNMEDLQPTCNPKNINEKEE